MEWVHCSFLFPLVFWKWSHHMQNCCCCCCCCFFVCSLDNLLQKNVILFFFRKTNFKMALIWIKGLFLTYFPHFLVTREKLQKFLLYITHSHTYIHVFCPLYRLFFCLTNFEKKIRIYQVWFPSGVIPGVDSYSCHFGAINK